MQSIIYRLLFVCFWVFSCYSASAIDERYAARELRGSHIAPDSTSMVMDTVYFNSSLKPLQTTFFVKNIITFQIDEAYRYKLPDEFDVTVTFKVHYTIDNNGTPETGVTPDDELISLSIGYSKYTKYGFKAVYIPADWWYKAEIEIISISAGTGTLSDFQDALVLTNEILINREYNFSCSNNAIQTISDSTSYVSTKGELKVYWSPERAADEYDLEWTYIDSAALANFKKDSLHYDPKKIFPGNATRVSMAKEEYFIPLLFEGNGTLFFRVRAVQVKQNGQRIESVWSSDYSNGLGQYDFRGHDTTLNWQASTSFAEEGKRKSVVQYFDGSLKSRQTVTKDNTTDTTIIAETFYDNQGRPVIQVMPAPSLSSIIKYTPAFNQLNGAEYSKDAYDGLLADTCHCRTGAPAMDTDSGAAAYYSPHNSQAGNGYNKYIPDARGYAFAETRYTSDNTGRISLQGGVSDTFQLGRRHETIYTYNGADQEELDALFGTEVGNASHYFKNTVQDANGQVSISYVDMHGRTIATALAGRPLSKLDTLSSKRSYLFTKDLIDSNSNVIKGMVIESSKGLLVTETGDQHFVYSLVPDSIRVTACNDSSICYHCIYDLQITISEECNDTSKLVGRPIVITRTNYRIDNTCDSLAHLPLLDTTFVLPTGSYLVTKKLTINKQAMDYYRDSIFLVHNSCHTLEQTIEQQKELLRTVIDCETACDSCDNLGLQRSIRQQMLADVTPPMGQYANPDSIDQFSVFWFANQDLPAYKKVNYSDGNGNPDPLNPQDLEQDQFIAEFKSSWADSLLQLHPEYPKLQKLEALAASNNWDVRFENTETYQAAVDSGFLNPGNFTSHPAGGIFAYNSSHRDPFFTDLITNGTVPSTYKTSMQDSLLTMAHDTSGNAISMWSLATIMAHCPDRDLSCLYHYKNIDSAFAFGSECSSDQDIAWQYFREMYQQEKREIIALILNDAQMQNGGKFSDLKELVDNHVPNFYDPTMMPPGIADMPTAEGTARDSLTKFINDNCAAYVQQWWQELKPCDFNNTTDSSWIIPKLIAVCQQGGDSAHLFGASTVSPTSTYTYKSFEEVIQAYRTLTSKSYDATCNVYLISAPLPYDQQPVYSDKPVYQKPDSCECSTITSLYNQYQFEGIDSSFSAFIYRTTGTRMYEGVLDTLRMACNNQINCSFLKDPLTLPPVLQCGVKDICVSCDRIGALNLEFKTTFPGIYPAITDSSATDSLQQSWNVLYERFMNQHLGFAKTTSEYLAFKDQCGPPADSASSTFLNQWLSDYKKYGHTPHLDASGCDTTNRKGTIAPDQHIYTLPVPLGDLIVNGELTCPHYYTEDTTHRFVDFDYRIDTMCLDSAGFTWETRLRLPDSLVAPNYYGASWWLWLYGNAATTKQMLMAISKIDGKGVAVCTDEHVSSTCADENIPGQHMNDWRVIKFQFRGRDFKYYIDDSLVAHRTLNAPMTQFWGWSISEYGVKGEIDYVKVYDTAGNILYIDNFDDAHKVAQISNRARCVDCETRFAEYYNERNSSSLSFAQIDSIYYNTAGYHVDYCSSSPLTLCGKTEPVFAPVVVPQHGACDDTTLFANSTGTLLQDAYTDSLINSFNDRYLAKCLSARYHESFTLESRISEYHYTLYYYDQAGNLLKTIPPAGVDVSKFAWSGAWRDSVAAARRNKQQLTPRHTLPTQYRYNTLNQVVAQQSPDGGLSEFWYDRLGRLVVSRNARQKGASGSEDGRLYSYTKYDSLGRITEVGQVSNTGSNGAMSDVISRNPDSLDTWLLTLNNHRGQITNTVYDLPYPGFEDVSDPRYVIAQKNLRNRVSYTTITDTGTSNAYNQGTFYTYDILGNVDQLLQDYGHEGYKPNVMNKLGNRWKRIQYQYDLISGKVNMVIYQPEWDDGFFHKYSYDAENRLTLVETSRDSLVWEKDARYEYYRHGPLARVTLGDQQVQGIDYAYTLQGWLKGINSTGGTDSFDMGGDGRVSSLNRYTARDAIGLSLNYFANDYTAIGAAGNPFPGYGAYLPSGTYRPLYNGNISSSSVYQKKFDYDNSPGGPLLFYNYSYDQLNRLTGQDGYRGYLNMSTGLWDSLSNIVETVKERIAYDPNGNILKYLRKSIDGGAMDSLSYFYYANTNQLKYIRDTVSAGTFLGGPDHNILDLDGQPDSNYKYDVIGNLVMDRSERIDSIKWNVYGKIERIVKGDTLIEYTYDALGNRISQVITTSDDKYYTWYVRDAQGNILSTYTSEGTDDLEDLRIKLAERVLYGSSRLGTMVIGDNINDGPGLMIYYHGYRYYNRGEKQYELSNHLGNVLATISDRKFGISLSDTSSLISYYEPDIVTAQDYYPFGMMSRVALPNSGVPYKFGFNGKMNDNEVKGLGLQQDYGMRIYDPRVGRFLSVDPLTKNYPSWSPYPFAMNRPNDGVDLDGAEWSLASTSVYKGILLISLTNEFTVKLKVVNNTNLSDKDLSTYLESLKFGAEKILKDDWMSIDKQQTRTNSVKIEYEFSAPTDNDPFVLKVYNSIPQDYSDRLNGTVTLGHTETRGNTQTNQISLAIDNEISVSDGIGKSTIDNNKSRQMKSLAEEIMHTAGLGHVGINYLGDRPDETSADIKTFTPVLDGETNVMIQRGKAGYASTTNYVQFIKVEEQVRKDAKNNVKDNKTQLEKNKSDGKKVN